MKEGKKKLDILNLLLLYGGLGAFLGTLSMLYSTTAFYIDHRDFTPTKAILYAVGESYQILMLTLFCLGYYKLRKMKEKETAALNSSGDKQTSRKK